jgi:3D (Asp-Asp-Asp) domain-containing protein
MIDTSACRLLVISGVKLLLALGFLLALLMVTAGCGAGLHTQTAPTVPPPPQPTLQSPEASPPMPFVATADSVEGITAKGTVTHQGIVAADPTVLPLGSVIQVSSAGAYSGTYVVTDTGEKITGRHIDIYIPSRLEAKQFGRKSVFVRVVRVGDNQRNHRESSGPAGAP